MSKIRAPRDLDRYDSAEQCARSLESIAQSIRRRGGVVKFSLQMHFWNDEFLDTSKPRPPLLVTNARIVNKANL